MSDVDLVPTATTPSGSTRGVIVFVVFAYALMWVATVPFWVSPKGLALPGATVVIAVAMFGPALASYLGCRVDRRPWRRTVGLGPVRSGTHPVRRTLTMVLLAFVAVVACTTVGTALAAALGVVRLDLIGLSGLPALPVPVPRAVIMLIVVVQVVVAAFTVNAFLALGEELGWRGYLLTALLPLGRVPAVVITGLVWAGWHTPLILLGYEFTGTSRPVAMLVFATFCVTSGAVLAWFRLRTDSVLPGAVAHGAINAIVGLPIVLIAAGRPQHPLLLPPAGLFGSLTFALLAVGLAIRLSTSARRRSVGRRPGG